MTYLEAGGLALPLASSVPAAALHSENAGALMRSLAWWSCIEFDWPETDIYHLADPYGHPPMHSTAQAAQIPVRTAISWPNPGRRTGILL